MGLTKIKSWQVGLSEDFISSLFTETSSKLARPQHEYYSCRLCKLTHHLKINWPSLVKGFLRRLHSWIKNVIVAVLNWWSINLLVLQHLLFSERCNKIIDFSQIHVEDKSQQIQMVMLAGFVNLQTQSTFCALKFLKHTLDIYIILAFFLAKHKK